MKISARNEATSLLTLHLDKQDDGTCKPLSAREWTLLARWLAEQNHTPEDLLSDQSDSILSEWADSKIPADRIKRLLNRGYLLGIKLNEWLDGNGIRLIGRSDSEYPRLLRSRLGEVSPPLLFASGNIGLFRNQGIAIVGSRNAQDSDLRAAQQYGETASQNGFNVVSGGAKGVDSLATDASLASGGTAIIVLGDSLIHATRTKQTREYIQRGDLLLVTQFAPDTGFSVGNAMGRNKVIYCLADAAIVIASQTGKGGTYSGAVEALKAHWIPVGVLPSSDPASGYTSLTNQGGIPLTSEPAADLENLLGHQKEQSGLDAARPAQASLFHTIPADPDAGSSTVSRGDAVSNELHDPDSTNCHSMKGEECSVNPLTPDKPTSPHPGLIEDFVRYWTHAQPDPTTAEDLAAILELEKSQVRAWLKHLVEAGRVNKSKKPVRYTLIA